MEIKELIQQIKNKNYSYYNSLDDTQKKSISMYMVQIWLSRTCSKEQIIRYNSLLNPFVFNLSKHPQLLYFLSCVISKSERIYNTWVPILKKESVNKVLLLIQNNFGYNASKAMDAIKILSDDDIISIAEENGLQKDEITAIKKELKNFKRR